MSPTLPKWNPAEVDLGFLYSGVGIVACPDPRLRPAQLKIQLSAAEPAQFKTATITMKLAKPYDGVSITPIVAGAYDAKSKTLTLDPTTLAADVFKNLGPKFGPAATSPPQPLTVDKALIQFSDGTHPIGPPRKVMNSLTIGWILGAK